VFGAGAVLLVVAAGCNALYQVFTRMLQDDSPYTTLFYSAVVGTLVTTLALPWVEIDNLSLGARALLAVAGLCAGLGHHLMITAYLRAPASMLTPFTYLQMLWATAYGFVLFAHFPDAWSFAGMAIVVAGGVMLARAERRNVIMPMKPLPAIEPL
jgi:drug/metabolite transporter (DMT)-like permease